MDGSLDHRRQCRHHGPARGFRAGVHGDQAGRSRLPHLPGDVIVLVRPAPASLERSGCRSRPVPPIRGARLAPCLSPGAAEQISAIQRWSSSSRASCRSSRRSKAPRYWRCLRSVSPCLRVAQTRIEQEQRIDPPDEPCGERREEGQEQVGSLNQPSCVGHEALTLPSPAEHHEAPQPGEPPRD